MCKTMQNFNIIGKNICGYGENVNFVERVLVLQAGSP